MFLNTLVTEMSEVGFGGSYNKLKNLHSVLTV